jgi:hypothetical protein
MKSSITVFCMLPLLLLFSCGEDVDEELPSTMPIPVSISNNSVTVEWEKVGNAGQKCYYRVYLDKPQSQNWWANQTVEYGYYYYHKPDDVKKSYPTFLFEELNKEREQGNPFPYYQYETVDYIDSTNETSIVFRDLNASTIYSIYVETRGFGLSGGGKFLFFRTKDE